MFDKRHEDRPWHDGTGVLWAEKYSPTTPWHYRDGVTVWVSKYDLTPDDDFLGQSVATTVNDDGGGMEPAN